MKWVFDLLLPLGDGEFRSQVGGPSTNSDPPSSTREKEVTFKDICTTIMPQGKITFFGFYAPHE
jgi:hypothetical protein